MKDIEKQEQELDALLGQTEEATPQEVAAPADAPVDGMDIVNQRIGIEQIHEAQQTLKDYKAGKANLEQRIIENEQWYKLRHWECMRKTKQGNANVLQPVSGWLFNSIANKHADAMDNYPSFNVLPREEGDKMEAKMLSSIIPVILEQNDFEETYDRVWDYKLKSGTGVYGVFWDPSKLNGLGDISIKREDILNLFWEPGVTDIQDSRNLFHVQLVDNATLLEQYPVLTDQALSSPTVDVANYIYDDTIDNTDKSVVVDWYYKRMSNGRPVLHYCKFVNDTILYATENETDPITDDMGQVIGSAPSESGLYDHGRYPFDFDPMFSVEGSPCGFGYIDVGKSAQEYIDRGNAAILENMLANAVPRSFSREDGGVNEEEYLDLTKRIVHYDGSPDSIIPIPQNPLSAVYTQIIDGKVNELKEVTGNRDVSTGGTTGGVTAAAGLAAMQEASGKLSRDANKSAYRSGRRVVLMIIELIRQFYDVPRQFRIMGEGGAEEFVSYSNAGIVPQDQGGTEFGVDTNQRIPLFDIEVTAQKQSPYSKMAQNELALQFYSAGFFNPQMADQALACLDMMDFDRKEMVMTKIRQNGGMYAQMQMMQGQMLALAQALDSQTGSNVSASIMAQMGIAPAPQPKAKGAENTEALGGKEETSGYMDKAREQAAQTTDPT